MREFRADYRHKLPFPPAAESGSTFADDWLTPAKKWQNFAGAEASTPILVYGGDASYEREAFGFWDGRHWRAANLPRTENDRGGQPMLAVHEARGLVLANGNDQSCFRKITQARWYHPTSSD